MHRPKFLPPSSTPPRRHPSVAFGGVAFRSLALVGLTLLGACDPDCADPGRIDGLWSVRSNSTNDAAELKINQGEVNNETELAYGIFANGESSWDVKYVPSNSKYTIIIAEQTFKATHEPDVDNCNAFALRISGDFVADDGAEHQFDWQGDLTWSGEQMGGTFIYDGSWTLDGATGTITIPKGELIAQRGSDSGETE